jgi:hypothetical protein
MILQSDSYSMKALPFRHYNYLRPEMSIAKKFCTSIQKEKLHVKDEHKNRFVRNLNDCSKTRTPMTGKTCNYTAFEADAHIIGGV